MKKLLGIVVLGLLSGANQFTEQVISCPQHTGDLIFPWLLRHLDI